MGYLLSFWFRWNWSQHLIVSARILLLSPCGELMSQNGQVSPHYCMAADCYPVSSTLRYVWKIEEFPTLCYGKFQWKRCICSCMLHSFLRDCLVFKVWLTLITMVSWNIFVDSAFLFVKPCRLRSLAACLLDTSSMSCAHEKRSSWKFQATRRWSWTKNLPGTSRTVERRSWAMQAIAFPSTFTGADGFERWETCWEIL